MGEDPKPGTRKPAGASVWRSGYPVALVNVGPGAEQTGEIGKADRLDALRRSTRMLALSLPLDIVFPWEFNCKSPSRGKCFGRVTLYIFGYIFSRTTKASQRLTSRSSSVHRDVDANFR